MAEDTHPSKARIYALANPLLLKRQEERIKKIFQDLLRVSDPARYQVTVGETSGWIEYTDVEGLWSKGPRPQLPNAQQAKRRAEDFLGSLMQRLASMANAQDSQSFRNVILLPALPKQPLELGLVPRPNEPVFDHWLYRTQPQLRLGPASRELIPVFGSSVDLRLGGQGQVIYYRARWRPLLREYRDVVLNPYSGSAGHHEHPSGKESLPQLVYVLDGDGIPQYYLSPYYLVNEGHAFAMESACAFSLTVSIARTALSNGMALTVTVRGGSGNYAFRWAAYSLDQVLESGFRELGTGSQSLVRSEEREDKQSTVFLSPGAYVVMVNVKDRKTGAFRHHQQQVHSVPIAEPMPLV
jgi:hypothetical protein